VDDLYPAARHRKLGNAWAVYCFERDAAIGKRGIEARAWP
jgi:hypothetical protein